VVISDNDAYTTIVFFAGVVVGVGDGVVVGEGVVVVGVVVVGVVAVGDGVVVGEGVVVGVGVGAGLLAKYPATPATITTIIITAAITPLDTPNLNLRFRSTTSRIYNIAHLNIFYCI